MSESSKYLYRWTLVFAGLLHVCVFERLASLCELGVDGIFHFGSPYLVMMFAVEKFFGELARSFSSAVVPDLLGAGEDYKKERKDGKEQKELVEKIHNYPTKIL